MAHETLTRLLKSNLVKKQLNLGVLNGLTGRTQIDYALGVVEGATEHAKEVAESCPLNARLQRQYETLKTGLDELKGEYPLHFREFSPIISRQKNPSYKSINGF